MKAAAAPWMFEENVEGTWMLLLVFVLESQKKTQNKGSLNVKQRRKHDIFGS